MSDWDEIPRYTIPSIGSPIPRSGGVWCSTTDVFLLIQKKNQRIEKLREILKFLWDDGYLIDIHEPECPEDDTCRCTRAKMLNEALEDG